MSTPLPIPPEDLTPEERTDPRLVRPLRVLALERAIRDRYKELLPRRGWDLAIIMVMEELDVTRSRVEKLVWGGSKRPPKGPR